MNTTLPIEEDQLRRWAAFADRVCTQACQVRFAISGRELDKAKETLLNMHLDAAAALVSLREAGAPVPEGVPVASDVPLNLLDTPANRRLARALRDAYEAAQEVDRERGQYDADEPEDGPTAMPIVELLAAVELECYGPAGHGEGIER